MIPIEIFAEDMMGTFIRYGLYMGAAFQIVCLVACVMMSDDGSGTSVDYVNTYYDKLAARAEADEGCSRYSDNLVSTDSDDCSSEHSSPGHRASINCKPRKSEKKKRR